MRANKNKKQYDRHRDHYVINPVGREFADLLIASDAFSRIDEAKVQLAETIGVRAEHIEVRIQMLVEVAI